VASRGEDVVHAVDSAGREAETAIHCSISAGAAVEGERRPGILVAGDKIPRATAGVNLSVQRSAGASAGDLKLLLLKYGAEQESERVSRAGSSGAGGLIL
jgi:hypothetical protein